MQVTIKHAHSQHHVQISAEEATRARQSALKRLLSSRKLLLILDLDLTLLNTVKLTDVSLGSLGTEASENREQRHQRIE